MTGLRPTPTRFTSYLTWAMKDAAGIPTLPFVFKQNGYHTVSNGKVYHHQTDDPKGWSEPPWRTEDIESLVGHQRGSAIRQDSRCPRSGV